MKRSQIVERLPEAIESAITRHDSRDARSKYRRLSSSTDLWRLTFGLILLQHAASIDRSAADREGEPLREGNDSIRGDFATVLVADPLSEEPNEAPAAHVAETGSPSVGTGDAVVASVVDSAPASGEPDSEVAASAERAVIAAYAPVVTVSSDLPALLETILDTDSFEPGGLVPVAAEGAVPLPATELLLAALGVLGLALAGGGGGGGGARAPGTPTDVTAPTAVITIDKPTISAGETATVTITFSETVTQFALDDLTAPNGVLSNLVQTGPRVWTATFTPTEQIDDATNFITLATSYTDLAGNAGTAASSDNYVVATVDGGLAIDGYISGARVFRDLNGDRQWNDLDGDGVVDEGDEPSVFTDAQGAFKGLGGYGGTLFGIGVRDTNGNIISIDLSTGLPFDGLLSAPAGSTVISPLTTLVNAALVDTAGMTPQQIEAAIQVAESKVAALLGLDTSQGSLLTTDPIATAATGGPGATAAIEMQLAATMTANLLAVISQTLLSADAAGSTEAASALVDAALSALIAQTAEDGSLNLSDPDTISGLIQSIANDPSNSASFSAASSAALLAVASDVGAALATVNQAIDAIDTTQGLDALTQAVAVQLVVTGSGGLLDTVATSVAATYATQAPSNIAAGFTAESVQTQATQNVPAVQDVVGSGGGDTTAPLKPVITAVADDISPVIGAVASGGTTNDTALSISGTAEAGSTVVVYNGAVSLGTATANGSGNWSLTTSTLSNGVTYAFTAKATDAAGNESVASNVYTVTVDTQAPDAPVITAVTDDISPVTGTVASGGSTNDTAVSISGTAEAGSTVVVYNGAVSLGTATANGSGNWSLTTSTLSNGVTYAFTAKATDAAGNESVASNAYTVTVDTQAPAAPTVNALTTNDTTPVIKNKYYSLSLLTSF